MADKKTRSASSMAVYVALQIGLWGRVSLREERFATGIDPSINADNPTEAKYP